MALKCIVVVVDSLGYPFQAPDASIERCIYRRLSAGFLLEFQEAHLDLKHKRACMDNVLHWKTRMNVDLMVMTRLSRDFTEPIDLQGLEQLMMYSCSICRYSPQQV